MQDKTSLQRDLYLHLLKADEQQDRNIQSFLEETLLMVVELSGGQQGYLELKSSDDSLLWSAQSFSTGEIENARKAISTGVIAEALKQGKAVITPSAVLDPRFRDRESVRKGKIQAVLCAPIGLPPYQGAIYLQGDSPFRPDAEETLMTTELFVKHVSPLLARLSLFQEKNTTSDPTQSFRKGFQLREIIGQGKALAKTLESIVMIAPLDVNVLLTGESGTGKTQLAHAIHQNSPRQPFPFMEVNCGALPENLIENELFGSVAGGHSTATKEIKGKITTAEGGTLFLDEIGELPLNAQTKLLQFLQTGDFFPLGASKPIQSDIRVLAATNVDLKEAIRQKSFREDCIIGSKFSPSMSRP